MSLACGPGRIREERTRDNGDIAKAEKKGRDYPAGSGPRPDSAFPLAGRKAKPLKEEDKEKDTQASIEEACHFIACNVSRFGHGIVASADAIFL